MNNAERYALVFREVGETARAGSTGVLITIDEIQYLARRDLSALIVGLHRISQLGLPLLVAGAGLLSCSDRQDNRRGT